MLDPDLRAAAIATVRAGIPEVGVVEVIGFPKMYVGLDKEVRMTTLDFFEVDGIWYAVGPLKS